MSLWSWRRVLCLADANQLRLLRCSVRAACAALDRKYVHFSRSKPNAQFVRCDIRTVATAAVSKSVVTDIRDDPDRNLASTLTYTLPPLSPEQEQARIVLSRPEGNVIINACAGSGKTTTLLQMARNINKKFLVLLYNRHLRSETIAKVEALGLTNIVVNNYHGLGYHYYSTECSTDQGLKRVVHDNMPTLSPLPAFDVLVMDEQQDMNPIIFTFVQKVLRDAVKAGQDPPQMMCLGDPRQEIYQFNNADKRFLTLARDIFPLSGDIGTSSAKPRVWTELDQRTSFRFSQPIADFVNNQLLRSSSESSILTIKQSSDYAKPRYVVCDAYSDAFQELVRLLESGITASDILILGPSLSAIKSPIRNLANQIALQLPEIRIHIPNDDDEDLSALVLLDKIMFASYHQAKGIEREAVIVLNFDASYHRYFDRQSKSLDTVGNTQYVAVTRAKKHLIMIHHHENDYLPFIEPDTLGETCEVVEIKQIEVKPVVEKPKTSWAVTDLTRNIPESVISKCFGLLDLELRKGPNDYRVFPPTQIQVAKNVWEGVAEITGTAVPAIFEWQSRGTCTMANTVFKAINRKTLPEPVDLLPEKYVHRIRELEHTMEAGLLGISDILYLANITNSLQSRYINKLLAIPLDHYTWFTDAHAAAAYKVLSQEISEKAFYERMVGAKFDDVVVQDRAVFVRGCVDIMDYYYKKSWELKWTNTLRPEHVLQAALYNALDLAYAAKKQSRIDAAQAENECDGNEQMSKPAPRRRLCRLLHTPTGQKIHIDFKNGDSSSDMSSKLINLLVATKIEASEMSIDDEQFLKEAATGFRNFIGPMTVPPWLNEAGSKSRRHGSV